jgi:signal transduction histidine kinase
MSVLTRLRPAATEQPAPRAAEAVSPTERAMLERFDAQRRLALLRVIAPGLFAVALVGLPFALQTTFSAGGLSLSSLVQDGIGVVAFAVALWATWRRNANLASLALFLGVSGVIVVLTLDDGPIQGFLDVTAVPEFGLFALPIAISGIFGRARLVATATLGAAAFTLALLLLTPPSPALRAALATPDGLKLFTVPLAAQLAVGVLMFAATSGFQRTLRELGDVRVAYEREKELDRLKDQFIASVNHELRTPIMALQGYIELARELGLRGDPDRQTHMLDRADESAAHLADLVRSVLSVRRIDAEAGAIRRAVFALAPVVLAASRLLDPREAGGQERDLRLDVPEEFAVYADQDRVRQVLVNLLSNATKYSPPGSPVEVTARIAPAEVPTGRSRSPTKPPVELVEVAVRDYGLGIPPDQAVLLFQRFVRLERDLASPVPGTGLGLAICRAYVEAMGGGIWVESSGVLGEGSTFRFTLPLAGASGPNGAG